uniref:Uncharacterized protein n=1 Tax=Eutreptiella gymnastica TaxID=73025 RepID=A0A7S1NTI7_9EUGL|mmetsp:Transcript_86835/g.151148  ORF Transcript_86835/g.151148 Transcript_86835/m.151148 type:complete len:304 (+) Transcript_86835:95-1006(+)
MESSSLYKGMFLGGTAASFAEVLTFPLDVVKTRMQVLTLDHSSGCKPYRGMADAFFTIFRSEGPRALFKGLPAALLRQVSYGSLRYGLYGPLKKNLAKMTKSEPDSFLTKVMSGTCAGTFAQAICNPTDLLKVRMQAAGLNLRSGYHTYDSSMAAAFQTIIRQEGILGLWKGVVPSVGRASVLGAAELSIYDETKSRLKASGLAEGFGLHVVSSMAAGFVATLASSPFDVAKSRMMNQPFGPDGRGLCYNGLGHCLVKSVQIEGLLCLWKGFVPSYARMGPRVVIVFVVMEQLRKLIDPSSAP